MSVLHKTQCKKISAENTILFAVMHGSGSSIARKIVASQIIANRAGAHHHAVPDVLVSVEGTRPETSSRRSRKDTSRPPNAFSFARWRVCNDTGFFLLHHRVRPAIRLLSQHTAAQHILEHPTNSLEIKLIYQLRLYRPSLSN